jgi:hypothetical protein
MILERLGINAGPVDLKDEDLKRVCKAIISAAKS